MPKDRSSLVLPPVMSEAQLGSAEHPPFPTLKPDHLLILLIEEVFGTEHCRQPRPARATIYEIYFSGKVNHSVSRQFDHFGWKLVEVRVIAGAGVHHAGTERDAVQELAPQC